MTPQQDGKELSRVEPNALEEMATSFVRKLVDFGVDGKGPLAGARAVADKTLAKNDGNVEEAVDDIVRSHGRLAAAGGFLTGVAGFTTMIVAVPLNVAEFYVTATRMTAAIAHLRGQDIDREDVRTAVLLTLVGADSRSVLAKARVSPGALASNAALERLPAPALMLVNKAIGVNILTQLGKRGLTSLGRAVPLVGGAVGAGTDWWLLRRIGADARRRFTRVG